MRFGSITPSASYMPLIGLLYTFLMMCARNACIEIDCQQAKRGPNIVEGAA